MNLHENSKAMATVLTKEDLDLIAHCQKRLMEELGIDKSEALRFAEDYVVEWRRTTRNTNMLNDVLDRRIAEGLSK